MGSHFERGTQAADVRAAEQRLSRIVAGDKPDALLEAIEPCTGVAAGLLMVINPGLTMSVTHHALRMPPRLFDGWMHTQPEYFQRSLFPAVRARPGDLWRDRDGLPEDLRKDMEVLHELDQFGLGEGAGLKLWRQTIPGGGEEHVLMALLTHRGQRFPQQIMDIGHQLTPALQGAVERLGLPFTQGRSLHAQVLQEDAVGFVGLADDGGVIELNQRAYELALRYREPAGVCQGRFSMRDFVDRARGKTVGGTTWQLMHPSRTAMLQVRAYVMPRERYTLPRDLPLLKLEEWSLSSLPNPGGDCGEHQVFEGLTPRQREIAVLLVSSGMSPQEIAYELAIRASTVRKHIEHIHRKLKVRSLGELVALVRKVRN